MHTHRHTFKNTWIRSRVLKALARLPIYFATASWKTTRYLITIWLVSCWKYNRAIYLPAVLCKFWTNHPLCICIVFQNATHRNKSKFHMRTEDKSFTAKWGCFLRWTTAKNNCVYMCVCVWGKLLGMWLTPNTLKHLIVFYIPHLPNNTRDLQCTHAHKSAAGTQLIGFHCDRGIVSVSGFSFFLSVFRTKVVCKIPFSLCKSSL